MRRVAATTVFYRSLAALAVGASIALAAPGRTDAQGGLEQASPPPRPRLYVFDCGSIVIDSEFVKRFNVTADEVEELRFSVPCYLIAHPRGTLMWELGVVPDDLVEDRQRNPAGALLPGARTLRSQLADLGYRPSDVTYFAFSHAHGDHVANANAFAQSTWLSRPAEREFMWANGSEGVNRALYDDIRDSAYISIETDEYDVFGDGSVVLKSAPGHSPGHQVLVLDLAETGRILLCGDLWHYQEERTLERPAPATDFDGAQTDASRREIEAYLARTGAALWIEHDFVRNAALRKAPAYYD